MTVKKQTGKTLKGAVLIMVITVMFVLIIMLMATLTVVSSANQRAYLKFEENQAYYSARSALDMFLEVLLADDDQTAGKVTSITAKRYVDSDGNGTADKWAKIYKSATGKLYDEEESGYKTPASGESPFTEVKNSKGRVIEEELFTVAVKNSGSPDAGASDYNANFSDKNDFRVVTYTREDGTTAGIEYLIYELALPATADSGNEYGRMADDSDPDDGVNDPGKALIKVEVLDRVYSPGHDAPNGKSWDKVEKLELQITSTVTLLGVEGTASVVCSPVDPPPAADSDDTVTTTGGYNGGDGTSAGSAGGTAILGDVYNLTPVIAGSGNNSNGSGSFFSTGNVGWNTDNTQYTLTDENDFIYTKGNLTLPSGGNTFYSKAKGTFIYAEKTLSLEQGKIGYVPAGGDTDDYFPISLIADTIEPVNSNGINVNGDILCNNYTIKSDNQVVSGKVYTNNLAFSANAVNMQAEVVDNVWTGELVSIDVNLSNNSIISNPNGTIEISGEIWWPEYAFITKSYSNMAELNNEGLVSFSNGTLTELPTGQSINLTPAYLKESDLGIGENSELKIYRRISLPFKLNNDKNNITVPTASAKFLRFFEEGAFSTTTGDLLNKTDGTTPDYSQTNIQNRAISAENEYGQEIGGVKTLDVFTTPAVTTGGVLSSDGILKAGDPGISYNLSINGNITVQLEPGKTYGDGQSEWTLQEGASLTIYLPEAGDYTFQKLNIVTPEIKEDTAVIENGVTKPPKVRIIGATGSKLIMDLNSFIAGYIYAPTGGLTIVTPGNQTVQYTKTPGSVPETVGYSTIVGNVIVGDFSSGNNPGLIYLNPNAAAENAGVPIITWGSDYYTAD